MLKNVFCGPTSVSTRLDNLNHPCGFDVSMTVPESNTSPSCSIIICSLPDGMSTELETQAKVIAKSQKMLDLLNLHCMYCNDCPYNSNPDTNCEFGEFWNELKGCKNE